MVVEAGKVTATYRTNYYKQRHNPPYEGESFIKYLGKEGNLGCAGTVNKKRVTNEYYKRVTKLWRSKLLNYNKHVAQNTFAVPLLIPTFGLLN